MKNYILKCDMIDIFKDKIPKDILNNKKIKSHIVYVHKTENKLLFPLEIIQYKKIDKSSELLYTHKFYEIFHILTSKAKIELIDKKSATNVNLKNRKINYLLKNNLKFQYLFFDIHQSSYLYDNILDIELYFISKNSYEEYEDYLINNDVYI